MVFELFTKNKIASVITQTDLFNKTHNTQSSCAAFAKIEEI